MYDDYIPVTKFTSNITGQYSKYPINACLPYYANQTKGQWPFMIATLKPQKIERQHSTNQTQHFSVVKPTTMANTTPSY